MNRHERRKAAARSQPERQRTIAAAADVLARAAATDSTVSGATLMLPSGETIYLPASPPSQVPQ